MDAEYAGDEDPEYSAVDRLADQIFERQQEARDSREAFIEREDAFDELRASMPLLQDDATAYDIVHEALALAEAWGEPELVETPAFVDLVRLVALASVADGAGRPQPEPAPAPPAGLYEPRGEVQLEAANGAIPQADGRDEGAVWGDRIVQAAQRLRPQV
jgi:hypothetical protein